jgi:hypothetical protein
MSPLVKIKRKANFKDFKRFGAFKGIVEQKNVVFNSFVCKLSFFGTNLLNKLLFLLICLFFIILLLSAIYCNAIFE